MAISKKNSGFTLLETIIYLALFSLLLGTAFVTAFQLIDGSGKLSAKTAVQEEGNFVLRKFNWALTGVQTISVPSAEIPASNALAVLKYNGDQIDVQLDGTKIKMTESAGPDDFITTDNVKVSNLDFEYIPASGSGPSGLSATATIDGIDFSITKYLRQ